MANWDCNGLLQRGYCHYGINLGTNAGRTGRFAWPSSTSWRPMHLTSRRADRGTVPDALIRPQQPGQEPATHRPLCIKILLVKSHEHSCLCYYTVRPLPPTKAHRNAERRGIPPQLSVGCRATFAENILILENPSRLPNAERLYPPLCSLKATQDHTPCITILVRCASSKVAD